MTPPNTLSLAQAFQTANPNFLLLGGRSPACLEWARFLANYGTVYVADSVRFALSFYSNAVKAHFVLPPPAQCFDAWQSRLSQIVQDYAINAIIPTCEEVFYLSLCQDPHITDKRWCLPSQPLIALHDKYRFAKFTHSHDLGIQAPPTQLFNANQLANYQATCHAQVFKPVFSRFASQTLICPNFASLKTLTAEGGEWLVQDYADGQELCSFSLLDKGKVLAHTAYTARTRAGKGASVDFVAVYDETILAFVQAFAKATQFVGQVGFDFIKNKQNQYVVLECNPRATSGIHLLTQNATALKQALSQILNGTDNDIYHAHTGTAQLSLAVLANAKNRLSPHFWQQFFKTPDVIVNKNDFQPAFAQILSAGEIFYHAWQKKLPLLATTTADIEFNGTPQNTPTPNAILQTWLTSDIDNVHCQKSLYTINNITLPISISHTQNDENSYVASPINQYGAYAVAESVRYFDSKTQQWIKNSVLPLIKTLKKAQLDNIIYVNNYLLSTNLYPPCPSEKSLRELLYFYQANYPQHAIGFRSLNDECYGDWCAMLSKLGAIKITSRRVYLLDCRKHSGRAYQRFPDFKKDKKLLEKYLTNNDDLEIIFQPALNDDDYKTIAHLYHLLYLDKYCEYNPNFNQHWIKANHQSGFLDLMIIKDKKHNQIIGVAGYIEQNGIMTTPILGYDTALPQKLGLYRLLSMLITLRGEQKESKVHLSAGAGEFKRNRGAVAYTEYSYVLIRHLPLKMQLAWQSLAHISNQIGLPLMIKQKV